MNKNLQNKSKCCYNEYGLQNPLKACSYTTRNSNQFNHLIFKWLGRNGYTIASNRKSHSHQLLDVLNCPATNPNLTFLGRWTVKSSDAVIHTLWIIVSVCFSPLFNYNRGIKS